MYLKRCNVTHFPDNIKCVTLHLVGYILEYVIHHLQGEYRITSSQAPSSYNVVTEIILFMLQN
jgi:hypothetical protein